MKLVEFVPGVIFILEIVLAILFYFLSVKYYRYVLFLNDIPTARIRSAPQGYVELVGKARFLTASPLYVPDLLIPCVWYECEYRTGQGDKSLVVNKRTDQSFFVDDGTGTCRIDPFYIKFITRNSMDNSIKNSTGLVWARWICVDEKVHVYGNFTSLYVDYRKQESDLKKSRLKKLKSNRKQLMNYDSDKDGNISPEEWDEARRQVDKEVDKYITEKQNAHKENLTENVLRPPDDEHLPYLVSAYKELTITRRYKIYSLGYMLGGLVLSYLFLRHLI